MANWCIDLKKWNVAAKKEPYPIFLTDEVLNTLAGYEAYFFLDGYLGYHQISIVPKDKYKITFVTNKRVFTWKVMPFGV